MIDFRIALDGLEFNEDILCDQVPSFSYHDSKIASLVVVLSILWYPNAPIGWPLRRISKTINRAERLNMIIGKEFLRFDGNQIPEA
jgi:hypothetical protein